MASGSTERTDPSSQIRALAAAGHSTPISIAGWLRIFLRIGCLLILLTIYVPLHYLWRILAYGSPFPKLFLAQATWIAGARVMIDGTPLRRDVVFISNHISWIDILALAGASGTAFVAKAELSKIPVIGWLCSLNRTVYVNRAARSDIAAQINALRESLADNWSVTIFPEGTTTDGHSLLPFKTSLLKVLEPPPPNVLVQPVLLDYGEYRDEIGWVGEEGGLNNAKRILSRKGSFPVRIRYLEPFSPEDHTGRKEIGALARDAIETALIASLGKPLRDFAHNVEPVQYMATKTGRVKPPLDS